MAVKVGEEKKVKIEGIVLVHAFFWGKDSIGDESTEMERDWCYISLESEKSRKGVDDPMSESAPCLKGLGCGKVMVCIADEDFLKHCGLLCHRKLKGSWSW